MEPRRPVVVLIGGGTASGKTTIAAALTARMGGLCIGHDRYYRDIVDPRQHNFDHPDALETELLEQHLAELAAGRPAELPRYDFATHTRVGFESTDPANLIVVEGILVLHSAPMRALANLCAFVEAPDDLRLARRLQRDVVTRGRAAAGVLAQYLETVRPMHQRFVAPGRDVADIVLDGEAPIDDAVGQLVAAIGALRR